MVHLSKVPLDVVPLKGEVPLEEVPLDVVLLEKVVHLSKVPLDVVLLEDEVPLERCLWTWCHWKGWGFQTWCILARCLP